MSTSSGPIRKQSAASSQNTRGIDMDIHSPLKDLDQGG